MKENDWVDQLFIANTHDYLLCFSNRGRVYWLKVWEVPQGTRNSRGKPIVNMFPLADGEKVTVVLPVRNSAKTTTSSWRRRAARSRRPRCPTSRTRAKAGIIAVDLDDGDYLIGADLTDGKHDVMLFSDAGKAVRFDEKRRASDGRNARGVRGMMLEEGQTVIALLVVSDEARACDRHRERLRQAHPDHREVHPPWPRHQGHDRHPTSSRNGRVVGAVLVMPSDEIMLITTGGAGGHRVAEIREMGRTRMGVTLISVDDGSSLSSVRRVVESRCRPDDEDGGEDLGEEGGEEGGDQGGDDTGAEPRILNRLNLRSIDGSPLEFLGRPSALPRGGATASRQPKSGLARQRRAVMK